MPSRVGAVANATVGAAAEAALGWRAGVCNQSTPAVAKARAPADKVIAEVMANARPESARDRNLLSGVSPSLYSSLRSEASCPVTTPAPSSAKPTAPTLQTATETVLVSWS